MSINRISIMTLNAWGKNRLSERKPALEKLIKSFTPDLLCLQEGPLEVQDIILKANPVYKRLGGQFPGWKNESNIIYNSNYFNYIEHGDLDIGGVKSGRRLFWAQLQLKENQKEILVSTAHYAWAGHSHERITGQSPRVEQSNKTVDFLQKRSEENIFFTGDLNEPQHPRRILGNAGFVDTFTALNVPAQPTRPARPIDDRPDEVNDWIFAGENTKPLGAMVVKIYNDTIPPSDHWPVLAFYEIE